MATRKEKREYRKYLNEQPLKEKLLFFWEYYKWQALFWLVGIIFLIFFLYNKLTAPVYAIHGLMLNATSTTRADELETSYIEAFDMDIAKGSAHFSTDFSYKPGNKEQSRQNYEASQEILAQSKEQNLDFLTGPKSSMMDLAYNNIFTDLRQFFDKATSDKYKEYFLYVDQAIIDDENSTVMEFPDPTNPDAMKDPVPVMLNISHCKKISDIYTSEEETLVFGLIANAPHPTNIKNFLNYIME